MAASPPGPQPTALKEGSPSLLQEPSDQGQKGTQCTGHLAAQLEKLRTKQKTSNEHCKPQNRQDGADSAVVGSTLEADLGKGGLIPSAAIDCTDMHFTPTMHPRRRQNWSSAVQ